MTRNRSAFPALVISGGAYFGTAGAFSLAINLLYLAGPLYMLQVYDRAVPSGSHVTLLMLTLALLLAYLALAGLDMAPPRELPRATLRLYRRVPPPIMQASVGRPRDAAGRSNPLVRDVPRVRH